jgi:hypothetical protein
VRPAATAEPAVDVEVSEPAPKRRRKPAQTKRRASTAPATLAIPSEHELAQARPLNVRVTLEDGSRSYPADVRFSGRGGDGKYRWLVVPPPALGGRIPLTADVTFTRLPAVSVLVYQPT